MENSNGTVPGTMSWALAQLGGGPGIINITVPLIKLTSVSASGSVWNYTGPSLTVLGNGTNGAFSLLTRLEKNVCRDPNNFQSSLHFTQQALLSMPHSFLQHATQCLTWARPALLCLPTWFSRTSTVPLLSRCGTTQSETSSLQSNKNLSCYLLVKLTLTTNTSSAFQEFNGVSMVVDAGDSSNISIMG